MFELMAILFVVLGVVIFLKVLAVLFEVGIFLALTPLKIFLGLVCAIVGIISLPFILGGLFFAALLPLAIIGLLIYGLVYLLK